MLAVFFSRVPSAASTTFLASWVGVLGSEELLAVASVVVTPSARERFTPRELADAYEQFKERGPQYVDAETGLRAAAYRFGSRVLVVSEEPETGMVVLIHPTP
jgi:hypothetical protein